MNTTISHFPVDIGQEIFSIVLFSDRQFSYSKFVKARWILCRASSEWMRVIHSYPPFWTHLLIHTFSPPEIISAYYQRAATRSLHLCLVFEKIDEYCSQQESEDEETVYRLVSDCLEPIRHAFPRAISLYIESDDNEALAAIHRVCRTISVPQLRDLVIRQKWHGIFLEPTEDSVSYPWFQDGLPGVQTLHLHMMAFPFTTTTSLHLRHLLLFNIYVNCNFRTNDFVFAVVHAAQLEELTLLDVYFGQELDNDLASLSVTTLRIGGGNTLAQLGPHLNFPKLRSMTFHVTREHDINDIILSPRLLENITHFTITDNGRLMPTLRGLYEHMPSVTKLDISNASDGTFKQLLVESTRIRIEDSTVLLPRIRSVALANESMNDVQNFCILHGAKEDSDGSHMELQEIIVVKPHRADRWENQRESWIKRHVSSVIVDSSYRQIYVDHELKLQQYRK